MTVPVVQHCPDGHFQRIIYDLAAYIADYPEQVLLAGIVSGWCVKWVDVLQTKVGLMVPRCTALASDLDKPAGLCSHEHTEMLWQEFSEDSGLLWDNYGIDDEIWVSLCLSQWHVQFSWSCIAVHFGIPLSRYSWDAHIRPASPDYQRIVQRSSCRMGRRVPRDDSWGSMSEGDYGWYWPAVEYKLMSHLQHWLTILLIALLQLLRFLVYSDSLMVSASSNGLAMTRRHWWRYDCYSSYRNKISLLIRVCRSIWLQ